MRIPSGPDGTDRTGDTTAEKHRRLLNHQKMPQFHRYDMAAEIIEAVK